MKKNKVNEVYQTTEDLHIFNRLHGNRPVNQGMVSKFVDHIKKNGMLQIPIIVNENYEVIDGQHRLEAAKELKCEIYYIVVPGYGIKEAIILNTLSRDWSKQDYLESFAERGYQEYVKLQKFWQKFNMFSFTSVLKIADLNRQGSASNNKHKTNKYTKTNKFNEGNWIFKDIEKSEKLARQLLQLKEYAPDFYTHTGFISIYITATKKSNFDFDALVSQIEKYPSKFYRCTNETEFTGMIETLYNYNKRTNKIHF